MFWTIGVGAVALLTILFYPSLSDTPEFNDLFDDSEALANVFMGGFTDLTSPEGFLNSQFFSLTLPVLFLIFAIAAGSGAIAAEEERGTLDFLLSHPTTRTRVVTQKFASMLVGLAGLAFVTWVTLVVGAAIVDMDVSLGRVAEATLSAALVGAFFGAFALAMGSAIGRRGESIGIASALALGTYLVNALAPLNDLTEPARYLSPFYYYIGADPLTNGLDPAHVTVLIGLPLILLIAAMVAFERRDLGV